MSYESSAQPIKIGYLMDFPLSDDFARNYRGDLTWAFDERRLLVARFGEV